MHLVHSAPVVTHRLASGAQPAGQQVCANAGDDISAYAKTRIAATIAIAARYLILMAMVPPSTHGLTGHSLKWFQSASDLICHRGRCSPHCSKHHAAVVRTIGRASRCRLQYWRSDSFPFPAFRRHDQKSGNESSG